MPHLEPAVIALIATLFGGVGLKVVEHWLGKSKVRIDEATKLREEYRIEIASQKEEIKQLESEVDKWKTDWYALSNEFTVEKTKWMIELEQLKTQLESAQKAIEKIVEGNS